MKLRLFLLPLTTLPLAPAAALAAEPATVQVVSQASGQGIVSLIFVRKGGAAPVTTYETGADGVRQFGDVNCVPDTEFQIKPKTSDFVSDGRWHKCDATPLKIALRANRTASRVRGISPGGLPPGLLSRHKALLDAMDVNDSEQVAALGQEIAFRLRLSGRMTLANDYAGLTVEANSESMRLQGFDVPYDVLVWDARQDSFVSTPEAVSALRAFQANQGLAVTGQWDLRTYEAIQLSPAAAVFNAPSVF